FGGRLKPRRIGSRWVAGARRASRRELPRSPKLGSRGRQSREQSTSAGSAQLAKISGFHADPLSERAYSEWVRLTRAGNPVVHNYMVLVSLKRLTNSLELRTNREPNPSVLGPLWQNESWKRRT